MIEKTARNISIAANPSGHLSLPGTVTFAAERFDAAVRMTLTAFFQKAFTGDATARHLSAADMRRDWERAFEA